MLVEALPDVLPDVVDDVATFQPVVLSGSEWVSAVVDLFADMLSLIMGVEVLAFFAAFGVFLAVLGLAFALMRTGKGLSR